MDEIPQPLRVLLVEDNPADAELMLRELRRAGFKPDATRVDTEADYLANLDPALDIILSDYSMPQFSGLRALELANERGVDIPFVIVSGAIGEETAVTAMKSGAADYLLKDRLARLGQAASHALEQSSMRKERKSAEEAMQQSEHKYRHLFESLSEAAFLIDAKSRRILDVNLCAETLLGSTRIEILGMNEADMFPSNEAADYCGKLASGSTRGKGELDEVEVQSKNGTTIPVRVSLAPIELYGRDLVLVLMADVTERKRAGEALRSLQRQYELILNSAGEGIYGLDLHGNIIFENPKASDLLGWKTEELLGRPAHSTIHHTKSDGNHYPVEECPIYASMRDGATRRTTNDVFWRRDGSSFRVDYVSAPTKDEHGHVRGCIVTFKDITEQFVAEARQKLQAEQYRLLFETNPNPMWVFDTKSLQILAVNKEAIKQYGYSREEFLKLAMKQLRPEEDVAELEKAVTGPQSPVHGSGRFRHMTKDGTLILVDIYSGPIVWEDCAARIVTAIDVTEGVRANERLGEQAKMLNQARDAIIIHNFADQRVTFWNAGAERLYGWRAEEAIGRPIGELIVADAQEVETYTRIIGSTGEFHGEVKQRNKDGKELTVEGRATLIADPDGMPRSVLLINTDITEQKKFEMQLLRAQRLESIGTLASGVAHDLNNILTPILMCAQTLRNGLADEDRESALSLIEESAQRGASVVKQVLTFARGVEGNRVSIKPSHLVHEMADIAQKTFPKSIEITSRYPEDLWSIKGDPTQLHQVLLNLSVNARDAMPRGGRLEIAAENVDVDESYAAMTPDAKVGPHVLFRMSDTGTGIASEMIDKIFDPFFTTKQLGKGTGLGLSTALGIVKSHGGFLSVYSEQGKGTTFKVCLPAIMSEEDLQKSKTPGAPVQGNGELILVVDDETNILRITKMILEKNNYQVISANDGPEALALFTQHIQEIKVVLTDISMPYMDGMELVRALRKMKPDVRIIAFTGQDQQARLSELQAMKVNNFLSKPFGTDKLLAAVHTSVGTTNEAGAEVKAT